MLCFCQTFQSLIPWLDIEIGIVKQTSMNDLCMLLNPEIRRGVS